MISRPRFFLFTLAGLCVAATTRAGAPLPLANGGFEAQLTDWNVAADHGMSAASAEAARTGKAGLRVTDASDTLGSSLASKRFPATPGKTYEARFSGRVVSGAGIAVYVRFFDAKGAGLNSQEKKNQNLKALGARDREWADHTVKGTAPDGATQVEVWIHSYSKNKVTADFDDVGLVEL
jgi:hypothetical protein